MVVLLLLVISQVQAQRSFYGSINRVIDGDSLLISTDKKVVEVRLYGVDCPEYNQPLSGAAKNFVRNALDGQKVTVKPEYYDSYGRLVAIVSYGDLVLNSELVQAGLAWVYPQYCQKSVCKIWQKQEKNAKKRKRGVWSKVEPIPPWKWKRMKHES
jgi:micrococcal nuclease